MDWDSDLIEPIRDLHVKLAEENVKMYRDFITKPNWFDRNWPRFLKGIIAFCAFFLVLDVVTQHWWNALIQAVVSVVNVFNLRSHYKLQAKKADNNAEWQRKLDTAESTLRELDPSNALIFDIINEE